MSLDWDITKCKINNSKDMTDDEWVVFQTVVFNCLAIDIGEITEGNWEEYFQRTYVWERIAGAGMCRWEDEEKIPVYLTPADIKKWIGLHTNVFPKSTDANFNKKVIGVLKDRAVRNIREFKKEQDIAKAG